MLIRITMATELHPISLSSRLFCAIMSCNEAVRDEKTCKVAEEKIQFYQQRTSSFFVLKIWSKLLWTYSLCLYFFGKRTLAEKLILKCWWIWLHSYAEAVPIVWTWLQLYFHSFVSLTLSLESRVVCTSCCSYENELEH